MILGNKCDMEDKRVVNKERGEAVSIGFLNELEKPCLICVSELFRL